jgi:sortase A
MVGSAVNEVGRPGKFSFQRIGGFLRHPPRLQPAGARGANLPLKFVDARWAVLIIMAICVWLMAFGFLFSGLEEHRAQQTLYAQLREELAGATTPIGGLISSGAPVALINAPRAGLHDSVVVEGTSGSDLRSGPGHKRDTPLPGQVGASQIFGRSTTFGGPFGNITKLRPGDQITVVTGQGTFQYIVDGIRRHGAPVTSLAVGGSRLSLVTSEGSGWRGGWAPSEPVYVDASLQGKSQASPEGRASYVGPDEAAMGRDTGNLASLALWLQILLAALLASVWVSRRWGKVPARMIGGVSVLALLWMVTDVASPLLPNLI